MFFFNTHVPDSVMTKILPLWSRRIFWVEPEEILFSNPTIALKQKIKLENKIPLTIPAGLAPSLTFSIVNKNNVFAILCYIYSSL